MNRALAVLALGSAAAFAEPKPLWTTPAKLPLEMPESAYYDDASQTIYVSNVGTGGPLAKAHKGWIYAIECLHGSCEATKPKGKIVTGLNAPKGMGVYRGHLWVTDIDRLVEIDLKTRKILRKIAVPGAKFLNDIAIHPDGRVFVSDTLTSKIHVVDHGKVSVFVAGPELASPNGLLVDGRRLIVAAWGLTKDFTETTSGGLYLIDLKTKKRSAWPGLDKPIGNLDGLVRGSGGMFYISDWAASKVYAVTAEGGLRIVAEKLKNSSDLGYAPGLLLVPEMGANRLSAYRERDLLK